jgi:hypothetical protein
MSEPSSSVFSKLRMYFQWIRPCYIFIIYRTGAREIWQSNTLSDALRTFRTLVLRDEWLWLVIHSIIAEIKVQVMSSAIRIKEHASKFVEFCARFCKLSKFCKSFDTSDFVWKCFFRIFVSCFCSFYFARLLPMFVQFLTQYWTAYPHFTHLKYGWVVSRGLRQ